MEEKLSGIVLGGVSYGESDKILNIFTLEKGVVSAKIKGVKKSGAKLKFASEPFCFAEFIFSTSKDRRTVTGASLIESFYPLREDIVKYFAGVDWGWEHHGSIVLMGLDDKGNYYLIKEIAKQHQHVEWWINEAKKIIEEYGDIFFYCDTARPDYIKKFKEAKIKAKEARKDVLAGISEVASLFKLNKLKVVEDNVNIFKNEIYNYVWKEGQDAPVKQFDDVLDSLRYAIYSDLKYGVKRTYNSR